MSFTILNVMLSRGLGGIEQSFLDYSTALSKSNRVVNVINSRAQIEPEARKAGGEVVVLPSSSNFDLLSFLRARKILHKIKPDAIICHGGRAVTTFRTAGGRRLPIIAPSHNYSFKRIMRADAIFAITEHLKQRLIEAHYPESQIWVARHGIKTSDFSYAKGSFGNPPTIGAIGRHVKKKGFDVFIEALALLKANGITFKAILAGAGEESEALKKLAASKGLEGTLEFVGWARDKHEFFRKIDIFCLPSLHEPFGIVALEAMAAGVPIASTASEGPSEILENNVDSLLVPVNDAAKLAEALQQLIASPEKAAQLSAKALEKVRMKYDLEITGKMLENCVQETISRFKKAA